MDSSDDSDEESMPRRRGRGIGRKNMRDELVLVTYRDGYIPPHMRRKEFGTPLSQEMEKRKREEIDDGYFRGRESPPTVWKYGRTYKGGMIPIAELLYEDTRYFRPKKLVIFIRGPPLTGKSYLARKIVQIEEKFGNKNVVIINGAKLSYGGRDDYGPTHVSEDMQEQISNGISFIIVEFKSSNSSLFYRCIDIARRGHYEMFCIELFIDANMKAVRNRMTDDFLSSQYMKYVREYLSNMDGSSIPNDVTMLDPSDLYDKNFKMLQFIKNYEEKIEKMNYGTTTMCAEDIENVKVYTLELIKSKEFWKMLPNGLIDSVNLENDLSEFLINKMMNSSRKKQKSAIEMHIEHQPIWETKNVIDYNHEHKVTVEEEVHDFKIFKSIDYNHQISSYLAEIVEDVDIDEILETKKQEKFERKKKFYQKFCCGEDKVEIYPSKWTLIDNNRPAVVGKRRKIKNGKILKILAKNSTNFIQRGVKRLKIDDTFEICCECLAKILMHDKSDEKLKEISELKTVNFNDLHLMVKETKSDQIFTKLIENLQNLEENIKNPQQGFEISLIFKEIFENIQNIKGKFEGAENVSHLEMINKKLQVLEEFFKNRQSFSEFSEILKKKEQLKVKKEDKMKMENIDGSTDDMEVDIPASTTPHHIDELLTVIYLQSVADDQKAEFMDYIKSFFIRLDKINKISEILKVVSQVDNVKIIFDFSDEMEIESLSKKIFIFPKGKTEVEILSSIARELSNFAMNFVYKNNSKPFYFNDDDRKEEIERILFEIEMNADKCHEIIHKFITENNEGEWNSKISGLIAEMIVVGFENILKDNHGSLWKYFEKTFEDVEKFNLRFKTPGRLSVF
ncbi:hypothetical protein PVAND_016370 [Polypedilum vanderplanki]|uniref:Uncharacterized protein n=1 Tax=Polypedilum vanderplanki TaxID=319348 RepID=A0A9J6BG26_POLVA|nr:hypothetical protein PVAND_016370 [Polypedilum vanderplanki]